MRPNVTKILEALLETLDRFPEYRAEQDNEGKVSVYDKVAALRAALAATRVDLK